MNTEYHLVVEPVDARRQIADWTIICNRNWTDSALGHHTPKEYSQESKDV